jgi:hypothetical protein
MAMGGSGASPWDETAAPHEGKIELRAIVRYYGVGAAQHPMERHAHRAVIERRPLDRDGLHAVSAKLHPRRANHNPLLHEVGGVYPLITAKLEYGGQILEGFDIEHDDAGCARPALPSSGGHQRTPPFVS